jgi:hypothetical protein
MPLWRSSALARTVLVHRRLRAQGRRMALGSSRDDVLLDGVRRGDVGALRELYDRHGGTVYGLAVVAARRRSADPEALTIEAFTCLWRVPPPAGDVRRHLIRLVGRLAHGAAVAAAV